MEQQTENVRFSHSSGAPRQSVSTTTNEQEPLIQDHNQDNAEEHHKSLLFFLISIVVQIVFIVLSFLNANADTEHNTLVGKAFYVLKILIWLSTTAFSATGHYCSKNFESLQKGKHSPYSGFELLILFSSLGFYVYTFFSLFAGIAILMTAKHSESSSKADHIYSICLIVINIIGCFQVYFQVMFMFQAVSVKPSMAKEKQPKRFYCYTQVMLFLIPFNFGIWFVDSFIELKNVQEVSAIESQYYGSITWKIIIHLTYPLILFFRFNSFIHCIRTYLLI